jgi:hypothetical protein
MTARPVRAVPGCAYGVRWRAIGSPRRCVGGMQTFALA